MKHMFRLLLILICVGAAAFGCGFLSFVHDIETMPEPGVAADLEKTDAIIVLTGGSERVTTGIELLESGTAQKLFISGVHKKLTLEGILGAQTAPSALRECCIQLGYQAGSTFGNAEETRDWMAEHNYHSLRLVTANYHMPRSLLVFHAAMPEVEIVPHPVAPDSVKLSEWQQHPRTIDLLMTEYVKFLLAHIRTGIGAL